MNGSDTTISGPSFNLLLMKQIARIKSQRRSDKHRPGSGFERKSAYIPRGYSKFAKMCDHYGGYDWFNTNHLRGIFNKYVGKPWDDCYSHICKVIPPRFKDDIYHSIGRPLWQQAYEIETAVEIHKTFVHKGIVRKHPDIEYKPTGTLLVPARWGYYQGYRGSLTSLDYQIRNCYYQDYFYIDGDTGLVSKIPAIGRQPKEVVYPRMRFDYSNKKAYFVTEMVEVDGVTNAMRRDYDFWDRLDEQRQKSIKKSQTKSQYRIVNKGVRLVENLDDNLNIILVEEPILVLKRIKQPK